MTFNCVQTKLDFNFSLIQTLPQKKRKKKLKFENILTKKPIYRLLIGLLSMAVLHLLRTPPAVKLPNWTCLC